MKGAVFDPVGDDDAVQLAVAALDDAIEAAAQKAGVTVVTTVVAWAAENPTGTCTSACLIGGDTSPVVLAGLAATILDDECERSVGDLPRVLQ